MNVGEEGDYIPIATLSPQEMIPALRWAAMRAILIFQQEVTDTVTRQCPQTTTFFEEKGEPKQYRTEVLPLTSLTPYRWTKPAHNAVVVDRFYVALFSAIEQTHCARM